jgi:hypothetical protein
VIIVSVITGATAVGTYNGTITLSATGISSVTVPVTITVDTTSVPPPASQTPHRLQVACISVRCSNTYPEVRPGMLWEQNGLGRLPGFILSTDSPYLKIVVTQNRCYGRCTCCLYRARRP